MSASGIKSKPVYSPLRADLRGRYHLMLAHGAGSAALIRVVEELRQHDPALLSAIRVLFVPDADNTAAELSAQLQSLQLPSLQLPAVQSFADVPALLAQLRALLQRALMGTRLYVAGPEHFIGRALTIALEFDLNKDEIGAEEVGSLARRLYCVHCRTTTEQVTTNIAECAGCGRWLMVRDHYSRRLAAYMGVMVDAEAPGELPPRQELYP